MGNKILWRFLPLAFLATALCGLIAVGMQQSLRQAANDPQIQIAEDASRNPLGWTGIYGINTNAGNIDISTSLAPYLLVYDTYGTPITGNGVLNGQYPNLPQGVFDSARKMAEDRITWQPEPGVRQAIVLIHVDKLGANVPGKPDDGFVMSGRSLHQVEVREGMANAEALGIWLFTIGGLLVLEIIFGLIEARGSEKPRTRRRK